MRGTQELQWAHMGGCHGPHWLLSNGAVPAPIEDPEITV